MVKKPKETWEREKGRRGGIQREPEKKGRKSERGRKRERKKNEERKKKRNVEALSKLSHFLVLQPEPILSLLLFVPNPTLPIKKP